MDAATDRDNPIEETSAFVAVVFNPFSLFLSTLQVWLLLTWTTAVETNKRPYILRCPIVRPVAWPLSSACCLGLYLYPPLSVNKLGSKRRKDVGLPRPHGQTTMESESL